MKIAIPRERRTHEKRVAASPDTVKKYVDLGFDVVVESGAGDGARFSDSAFEAAGAVVVADPAATLGDADIVLHVQPPLIEGENEVDELALMNEGTILLGMLAPTESTAPY